MRNRGALRRLGAFVLAALLIALSPGLGAYQAVAANVSSRGLNAAVPVLPAVPGLPSAAIPAIPALPGSAIGAPGLVALPGAAGPAAATGLPLPTAHESLRAGVERLEAARGSEPGVLNELFTGSRDFSFSSADGLPGAVSGTGAAPLQRLGLPELQALASDPKASDPDRRSAVKAIADRSDDPARLALEEIGARSGGSAADYEIKRLALRRLAEQGKVVSLPAVSEEHARELLEKIAADKPQAVAVDYDDTLEDGSTALAASAETGRLLKAVADTGAEVMVLTGRSDREARGIHEALSTLAPEQRAAISVGSDFGARVSLYDAQGAPRLVREEPAWSAAQIQSLEAASKAVSKRHGLVSRSVAISDYRYTLSLRENMTDAQAAEAAASMRERLASAGLNAQVKGREDFITVVKFDKSLGVALLRGNREAFARLRDVFRFVPRRLQALAQKISLKMPGDGVPAGQTLLLGDRFFGEGAIDTPMIQGAPGALALSVGGKADPRLDNVFVWPVVGSTGARQILEAAASTKPAAEKLDKKAIFGLFSQRSIAIAVFIPTIVAYPFVAIPTVGVAAFGALMAFGTLAGIAMGPLNGLIAKKLSSRNAMLVNAGMRTLLSLALPAFWALGILNFWTLLAASIATGWLQSSIIMTESIFFRRLAGKQFGTVNALAWMNYLVMQVVMGLLIGFGHYLEAFQWIAGKIGLMTTSDMAGLMIPFVVSAAMHALVVAPIIALTIPNVKADASSAAKPAVSRGLSGFLAKYWKEGAFLAVGIAAYFWVGSTIPAALALIYWISRTDAFKKLWANRSARNGLLFSALAASVFFPLQHMILPLISGAVAGAAGKEQLLSQLLGALFFGQLIANSGQAKLPQWRIPLIGRLDGRTLLRVVVIGLAVVWSMTSLFPGIWLAAAGVAAGSTVLMRLSDRLTDRGWIQYFGLGLAGIALPLLLPGYVAAIFIAALSVGLVFGPVNVALSNYFFSKVPKSQTEEFVGVQGSLFNAAITLGFGIISLLAGLHSPVYPGLLISLVALFAAVGAAFFFAPRRLPGLPDHVLKAKEDPK